MAVEAAIPDVGSATNMRWRQRKSGHWANAIFSPQEVNKRTTCTEFAEPGSRQISSPLQSWGHHVQRLTEQRAVIEIMNTEAEPTPVGVLLEATSGYKVLLHPGKYTLLRHRPARNGAAWVDENIA